MNGHHEKKNYCLHLKALLVVLRVLTKVEVGEWLSLNQPAAH